jgi:RHS repeat-associated protein
MGRTNIYTVEKLAGDISRRTMTDAAGLEYLTISSPDGTVSNILPDGTSITTKKTPSPRFGMQAPLAGKSVLRTPGGLTSTSTTERAVALADETDPMSLLSVTNTATLNGRTWTSIYTASNRTITAISPMGHQTSLTTDSKGRPLFTQTPGIYSVTNTYDSLGRITEISQGTGNRRRAVFFNYGSDGLLHSQSNLIGQVTTYQYDQIGRITNSIRPDGSNVAIEYDRSETPVKVTMPDGEEHSFAQNPVYLPASYTPPDVLPGDDATYTSHNIDRQQNGQTLPNGNTITNTFSAAGRLTRTTAETPNGDTDYIDIEYDSAGRVSQTVRDGDWNLSTLTYSYDGPLATNVAWIGDVAGSVGYKYNNDFALTALSINNSTVAEYAYNPDGALTNAGSMNYTYAAATGFLTNSTLDRLTENISYNGFGEAETITTKIRGTNLCSFTYARNQIGMITNFTETIQSTTISHDYIYDALGQLIEEKTNGTTCATYQYDKNGNRTNATVNGQTTAATYDDQDRLLTYGNETYGYSPTGVTTSRTANGETTTYRHDAFGELQEIETTAGDYADYQYDDAGRRIARYSAYSDDKYYLYKDAINPIAELDSAGDVVAEYIYGSKPYVPEYMIKSGTTYKIITDRLGSVRMVVNANTGAIAQRIDYDAFGNISQDTNPGFQPFGFHGGLYDPETGLTRFGARDYNPRTGRWLSRDPIGISGGLNLYQAFGCNPVNFIDPFGNVEFGPTDSSFTRWRKAIGYVLFDGTGNDLKRGAAATADGVLTAATMDGLFGLFDPNLFDAYYDECSSDTKISHGLAQASFYIATIAVALPQGATRGGTQAVSHWGPRGMSSLRSGDWVMTGGSTTRNWIMAGGKYRHSSSITQSVPKAALQGIKTTFAEPFGWAKSLIGQRRYLP